MRSLRIITKAAAAAFEGALPPEARALIKERKGEAAKESYAAYALLYTLIKERGYPPYPLAFTETGAPTLTVGDGALPLYVSVAHTERLVAAVLSDRPVGIDVEEPLAHRARAKALAERFLSPSEAKAVLTAPTEAEAETRFLTLWTQMEAEGKRRQSGVSPLFKKNLPPPDRFPEGGEGVTPDGVAFVFAVAE